MSEFIIVLSLAAVVGLAIELGWLNFFIYFCMACVSMYFFVPMVDFVYSLSISSTLGWSREMVTLMLLFIIVGGLLRAMGDTIKERKLQKAIRNEIR